VQEQVPECPHCREYMLYAGKKNMTQDGFEGFTPKGVKQPLLSNKVKLNVYVCSACFHVSEFLSEEDRIALIENVSGEAK
jgi:DNA-directed RNA polymerase subunit RPC12/RpoP